MKKIKKKEGGIFFLPSKKMLLMGKLTALLFLIGLLQVSASSYSQSMKLSLSLKNVTIQEVFTQIEKQSEYRFFYDSDLVDIVKKTSVACMDQPLPNILSEIFRGTDIAYEIKDHLILVKSKSETGGVTSQQRSISGKVVDSSGLPLPGVSVFVKGTTTGVITDLNGKYLLEDVPAQATLVFSFVGMKTQEIVVTAKSRIDVTMVEDAIGIEEVVAIGYGTMKKSDITGALTSIKADDLKLLPSQRVDQAIQGNAPGVMVLNTDGAPGGNTIIRIRGMSSITGGNQALVVIDGQQGGNINTLDPNDIQSVEILKDASSTAIYGSKGANGVILITTKTGREGKPMLSFSTKFSIQKVRKVLPVMSAGDFARTTNAYKGLNNLLGTPPPIFTDEEIAGFDRNGGTDWQEEIYRIAPMQSHSLSVSGGTDKMKYFFSGGYMDQKGIVINSDYKRINSRVNISADISKWLSTGLNANFVKSVGSAPPFGGDVPFENAVLAILQAPLWSPTIPVRNDEGKYSKHPANYGDPMAWNPVATALETDVRNTVTENYLSGNFTFKILKGLTFKVSASTMSSITEYRIFSNEKTFNGRMNNGSEGEGRINTYNYKQFQNTNILNYDRTFNKHHIVLTAVGEQQSEASESSGIRATGFTVVDTGLDDLGSAKTLVVSSGASERALISYLGRINYSFSDKYLLTASYRADGSSVFGKNNKWGYFPSVAVAWRASEEEFIKKLNAFSDLKFRVSYGVVGNQAISAYQSLAALKSGYNYPYNGGTQTDLGFSINRAANPDLKWESTTSTNIGLNYGLFNGRLSGSVDVYKKKTTDLLLYRNLPYFSGLGSIIDNIGSVENKGLELSFSGDPCVGTFKWNTNFNISWNRNEVVDMGDTEKLWFYSDSGGYAVKNLMWLKVGEPFGQMYGYKVHGLWKENERAEAAKYGQLPGQEHYDDLNNDGKIDILDEQVIGNAMPKFIFGFTNRFSYKVFELSFLIQGVYGNDIFNMQRIRREGPWIGTSPALLDRYTIDNQDTDVPAFIDSKTFQNAGLVNKVTLPSSDYNSTSRYVEDGSYVRLKNVSFGYNFPASWCSRAGIKNLRSFISATNLVTLTKYKGSDPEVSSWKNNDAALGVDLGNYPPAMTFTFGVEVTF